MEDCARVPVDDRGPATHHRDVHFVAIDAHARGRSVELDPTNDLLVLEQIEHTPWQVGCGQTCAAVAVESLLPVGRLPGLSLVVRAFRP